MLKFQQEEKFYTCFVNESPMNGAIKILEFGYSRPKAKTVVGPRIRECYLMHFVLSGAGRFDDAPMSGGEGFLICPNQLHSFSTDPVKSWEHCWIGFGGDGAEKMLEECGVLKVNHTFSFKCQNQLKEFVKKLCENESLSDLTLLSLFYYMLSLKGDTVTVSERLCEKKDDYVEKAVSLINSSYMDSLQISYLAESINISQKYLWRIFTEKMGLPPQKYLLRVRMETAKRYLTSTNLTVAEIARSVGYGDAVSFIQNFKRYEKMTPTEFRCSADKI